MLQSAVQFNGMMSEDAHAHIKSFWEFMNGIKVNAVPKEAIPMSLFPLTLNGAAKQWLNNHPHHSIISCDDLCKQFFARYIPPSVINALLWIEKSPTKQEYESENRKHDTRFTWFTNTMCVS
ncbi:unnamed protein product [Linum trigynum]|uniref:Retrotransposon gag domain-containing protein n=1 Tax=Linum trigynum TaxID=586398 RepID=A0AAV2EBU9_9ROSI